MKIEYTLNNEIKTLSIDKIQLILKEARLFYQNKLIETILISQIYKIFEDKEEKQITIMQPILSDDGIPYGKEPQNITLDQAFYIIDTAQESLGDLRVKYRELNQEFQQLQKEKHKSHIFLGLGILLFSLGILISFFFPLIIR